MYVWVGMYVRPIWRALMPSIQFLNAAIWVAKLKLLPRVLPFFALIVAAVWWIDWFQAGFYFCPWLLSPPNYWLSRLCCLGQSSSNHNICFPLRLSCNFWLRSQDWQTSLQLLFGDRVKPAGNFPSAYISEDINCGIYRKYGQTRCLERIKNICLNQKRGETHALDWRTPSVPQRRVESGNDDESNRGELTWIVGVGLRGSTDGALSLKYVLSRSVSGTGRFLSLSHRC